MKEQPDEVEAELGLTPRTIVRANARYQLVLFDRLNPAERTALDYLRADPELYGVLRPLSDEAVGAGAGQAVSVSRDTALLFLTLGAEPGPVPAYVRAQLGPRWCEMIAKLVLDGVLEVQNAAGGYTHGPAAWHQLRGAHCDGSASATPTGAAARLSVAAVRYAAGLAFDDPASLSRRMYHYNRLPLTPQWAQRHASPEAVARTWGIAPAQPAARGIRRRWIAIAPSNDGASGIDNSGWLAWRRIGHEVSIGSSGTSGQCYKLYVSPACEALAEVVEATVAVLSDSSAFSFKLGSDAWGLLRPDKIVAYFRSLVDLQEAAHHLGQRVAGMSAHGVPFTADISGDGLLSWGVDPPGESRPGIQESWRLWITNRLAVALLQERSSPDGREPSRFALDRLRMEGVDTATWTPSQTIWPAAGN